MKFAIEAISDKLFSDAMAGGGKLDDAFFYAKYLKFIEASDVIEAERLFRLENDDDEILEIAESGLFGSPNLDIRETNDD